MTRTGRRASLLVVDIQNGFISEPHQLPVAGGVDVIPVINRLLPIFPVRVASQDWHPPDHGSFASNHPGKRPFEMWELSGVPQVLWPDHCVQGSRGADFHPEFDHRLIQAIFRKGTDPRVDSYSAFADNVGENPTGLQGYLQSLGVDEIFLAGLALDYCVKFTALDARRLMPELGVSVILDACRPVDPRGGNAAKDELSRRGVRLIVSGDLV